MNIAVGFGCLVVFGLLMEANGFTVQQQLMEQQREHRHVGGITKRPCKILGGKCQSNEEKCNGTSHTGKIYCRYPKDNGCCVPPPPPGCVFGDTAYPNGAFTEDTCMVFQCCDGSWNYTGIIQPKCNTCTVEGDPHITPFLEAYFNFYGKGIFDLTQLWLNNPEFGVKADFVNCIGSSNGVSCISSISYYEPGIEVHLTFTHGPPNKCPSPTDPTCAIQVSVNGQFQNFGNSVNLFYATGGTVLVFNYNHIKNESNIYCWNIVGSKGLSASLCANDNDYPYAYVFAIPTLTPKLTKGCCGGKCTT